VSVVIGLRDNDRTVIGCDGRLSNDDHIIADDVPKWFNLRGVSYCIGMVGQYRGLSLVAERAGTLAKDLQLPAEPESHGYAVPKIAAAVRDILADDGWVDETKDGKPRWLDIEFLIAWPNGLVHVSGVGTIRNIETYIAIGSGSDYALGALWAMQTAGGVNAEDRVDIALGAAMRYSGSCGGKVLVDVIGGRENP
jgi:ATP-dependent protease HslVU (ClpYQ) peptidase subunit